jgi:hypothetical protein
MKEALNKAVTTTGDPPRRTPVKVKLHRITAGSAQAYPPDGMAKTWWPRLQKALGTTSGAFVNQSLFQLIAAARLHCGGVSEITVNGALALIEAAEPRDEIEGALAVQLACTHSAAMVVLARLGPGHGSEKRVAALGSAAARLLTAYVKQVECWAWRKHRRVCLLRSSARWLGHNKSRTVAVGWSPADTCSAYVRHFCAARKILPLDAQP